MNDPRKLARPRRATFKAPVTESAEKQAFLAISPANVNRRAELLEVLLDFISEPA